MRWLVSLFRRILDALSAPFRPLELSERTDAEALASDWQAVGDDLRQAMAKFESEGEMAAIGGDDHRQRYAVRRLESEVGHA